MTFIQHFSRGRHWRALGYAAIAVTGSLLSACNVAGDAAEEPAEVGSVQQALSERFDGETLLRGVFFGRGPVAALLPEIWGKVPLEQEDAAEAFRSGMKQLENSGKRPDEELLRLIASNQSAAARLSGLDRSWLWRLLEKYGIAKG